MAVCSQDVRQFGSGKLSHAERSRLSHSGQSCAACSCQSWYVLLVLQNPRTDSVGRSGREHGRSIPFASFRCAAEFGRYRGIGDMEHRTRAQFYEYAPKVSAVTIAEIICFDLATYARAKLTQ